MTRQHFRAFGAAVALVGLVACGGGDDSVEVVDAGAVPDSATTATAPAPASTGMLDPDQATREELVAAGLDEASADALIAGRPYADMTAVDQVLASLPEERREQLYARVWKPLDLNNASGEEILLIPGMNERMEHEFEEYRPYDSMEKFRREIGKYVDSTEVARLEQYVTIR